ncbi:pyrophosphorylase 5 [Corchorus olitorius]|uniref:Pyrophosphorylase 5 n=1 Tax=Corchorus olitorius TaxID=93759 RepID=A0A1R3KEZ7_9ROSI|nr:pyrophosphorylase 5 [Corchorus olitorius]
MSSVCEVEIGNYECREDIPKVLLWVQVIESSKGSKEKYEVDKKIGLIKPSRKKRLGDCCKPRGVEVRRNVETKEEDSKISAKGCHMLGRA